MKKLLAFVLIFCLQILCSSFNAQSKMVLKYGHVAPPQTPHGVAAVAFADYVKERTGGDIQIDVFPSGELGGERSLVEQVQGGTLDMADSTTAVIANFVPQVALYDLPFLWPSRAMAYTVMSDSEFQKIFFDLFPARGFKAIGYTENEFRDITNTKHPIHQPSDFKEMKIRVIESPIHLDFFKALGASPVPMPFPEVYSALQQGAVEAQDNPIVTSHLVKFTEVCPYVSLTGHILSEAIVVVNLDLWDSLSKEHQQVLMDAGQMYTKMTHDLNVLQTAKTIKEIKDEGNLQINKLTAEERAAFFEAVKPIHKKYAEQAGSIPDKEEYGAFAGMNYYDMIMEKISQYQ